MKNFKHIALLLVVGCIPFSVNAGDTPIGQSCVTSDACAGSTFAGTEGVACCLGKCEQKKKDWIGIWYCPHECVGESAKPGTCK
jgi:hypothetical protein